MTTEGKKDEAPKTIPVEDFEKEVEKRRKFQAEAEDFRKRFDGVDLERLKASHEELAILKKQGAVGDEKKIDELLQSREAEIRKQVQKDIDESKGTISKLQAENKELKVVDRVFALAASKFNDDCHDDVKAYIRKYGDLDDGGEIVFKDDTGKPRYVPGSTTQVMRGQEFIDWLSGTKQSWAKPTTVSGTKENGTKTKGSNGQPITAAQFAQMDSAQQVNEAINKGGAEAAKEFLKIAIF